MRVVLDTNVIVSAFLVAVGASARIVAAWRAGRLDVVVSPALLAEYAHSLAYPRILRRTGWSPERVATEVAALRELAIVVEPVAVPAVVATDPDDDQVLAAAVAGGAAFVITGDEDLLALRVHAGIRILSPAAFALLLAQDEGEDQDG